MNLICRILFGFLILAGLVYFFCHLLKEKDFVVHSDEQYYFEYAQKISQAGPAGFKDLIAWFAQDPQAKIHPTPSRAGYILFTALLFKLFGCQHFVLGVFSAVCFLLFLILNFYYVKKFFDLDTALLTCLFLSSSPLLLGMARRALIESPLNLLWGACVWLLFDFLFNGQMIKFVGFLSVFTLSLFFKEGSLILLPFFVLSLFYFLPENSRFFWPLAVVICVLPLILLLGISTFLFGGWGIVYKSASSLVYVYRHIGEFNHYVARYCQGPWYSYIIDFTILTPITSLLAFGYSFYYFLTGCKDDKKNFFLLYAVAFYLLLCLFQDNQNIRFAMNLEMVIALCAAFGLQSLCRFVGGVKMNYYLVPVAIIIAVINILNFNTIFFETDLVDPVNYKLLLLSHVFS